MVESDFLLTKQQTCLILIPSTPVATGHQNLATANFTNYANIIRDFNYQIYYKLRFECHPHCVLIILICLTAV